MRAGEPGLHHGEHDVLDLQPSNEYFVCAPDVSGDLGAVGDACEFGDGQAPDACLGMVGGCLAN